MSDCCLTPTQQLFSYIMLGTMHFSRTWWWEQCIFQEDDDEVRFVLDQHAEFHYYSASSLKQHSADRNVAPLGHLIMIPRQPVFGFSSECSVLRVEATNVSFTVFGLTRSTALEASKLTITPPMRSFLERGIRQYILSIVW